MLQHTAAQISGVYVISISSIGIFFNVLVLHHFLQQESSNFFILCISKSISNLAVLFIYLIYIGPSCLCSQIFFNSDFLNKYLNQGIAFGLYLQGPLTQLLISIDRFLVVYSFRYQVSKSSYSTRVTQGMLAMTWIFAVYFSTMIGFPDDCLTRFSVTELNWLDTPCTFDEERIFFVVITIVGGVSNILNVMVVRKLICTHSKKTLSRLAQKRRKRTKKFFFQSCIQDWIYSWNLWNDKYLIPYMNFQDNFIAFMMNMGSDVLVQGVDGLIMLLFNWQQMKERRKKRTNFKTTVFTNTL